MKIMGNTFKRFLAMVLALTMVLSYVPFNTFATETEEPEAQTEGTTQESQPVTEGEPDAQAETVEPITGTITGDTVWEDGSVIGGVTIAGNVTITVKGTVTVAGTIRLSPDAICNVVFNGEEDAKLIRGGDFTGQMFYAEGVSGNFQNLTINNITLDGGAVWTGDVDKTLNRGKINSGILAKNSAVDLRYANVKLNNSVLQNHDNANNEKASAVYLRYYSSIEFNSSVVRNNNSQDGYGGGGVISVREGGTVKTNNAEVYGNSGAQGGFYGTSSKGAFGGVCEVYNSKFHNNFADAGAVFDMQCNSNKGYLKIDGCEFYENASGRGLIYEHAYSRPVIISNSYFHANECAVWDCHADPVLDLSGKIVVEEDPDYQGYLFETPLVLSAPLAEGSSIAMSVASLNKLNGCIITGTAEYSVTKADLAKLGLPEGYATAIVDTNGDGFGDLAAIKPAEGKSELTKVVLTLKDNADAEASAEGVVYAEISSLPVNPFIHKGLVFAGWVDVNNNAVAKQMFTEPTTLYATWKIETPIVTLGRKDQGANINTLVATITNQYDNITYTYQWYKADVAIEGATSSEYAITVDATYKCVVTASAEGSDPVTGSASGTASVKEVPKNYVAQIGTQGYETLAEAIAVGGEIKLLADVVLDAPLVITGNVTIEGAYTITRADDYTGTLFTVDAGATLTLDGGLVIDGGNAWVYTKTPLEMDMANGAGTYVGNHITPAEGGVNGTASLIVNNGALNANKVTIQNSYSTNGVSAIDCGASSVTTINGATLQNIAANRSGAVVYVGGADAVLTIKGETRITGNFGTGNGGIIQNYGQGTTVNLEGGSIDNNHVGKSGTVYASYSGNANKINTFNMSGGIITKNIMEGYGPVYIHTNTVWNMTGGEISENTSFLPSYVRSKNNTATISGGKIVNNVITGEDYSDGYYVTRPDIFLGTNSKITGGTFTQDVSAWLAPNIGLIYDEATGTYTGTDHVYNLYFRDPTTGEQVQGVGPLQGNNAASLVATGKLFYADYYKMELEVLCNVKIDETVVIDYPMTINLNGKTLTAANGVDPMFRIESDVVVTGEGKLNARNGEAYVFILGKTDGTKGNLTIENGIFYGETTVASVTNGKLTINGGKFAVNPYKEEGKEDNYDYLLNCIDANYKNGTAVIEVNGGVFYKFNPADNAAEGTGTNFVAEGYVSEELETDYFTVRETNYVAEVNGIKYESLTEALKACTNGETVKLIADITYDADDVVNAVGGATGFGQYPNPSIIYIGGTKGATDAENQPSNVNAVLDLNGHTITNNAEAYLFMIMDNAKLTFKDSIGTGAIVGNSEAPLIWVTGTETVVTIESGKYAIGAYGSMMWATHSGDLVIKGGEFSTTAEDASSLIMRNSKDRQNSKFFISGKATVTVTGGTFKGFNPEKMLDDSKTPAFEFNAVAEGYKAVDNGDGTWIVDPNMIFEVHLTDKNGEAHWLSPLRSNDIHSALEKAKIWYDSLQGTYDFTLKILDSCTIRESVVVDFPLTIDLCGNTLTAAENVYPVIRVQGGADVTVTGNGSIVNATDYVFVLGASDGTSAGNLTIESGSYTGLTTVASVTKGTLTIKGGEFAVGESEYGATYLLNCVDANYKDGSAVINVTGGTFMGFNPEANAAEGANTNFVAKGYKSEDNGDGTWSVVPNMIFEMHLVDANGEAHWLSPMSGNDINSLIETCNVWYDSLQGTYSFTLKVLESYELDETVLVTFPMTIDLCGNTLTVAETMNATPAIRVLSDVTVTNGTVDATAGTSTYAFIVGNSTTAGTLTIVDGTYKGSVSVASVTKGTLNISGGNFESTAYNGAYEFQLNCIDANYKDGSAVINVTGGTFVGFNPENNAAEGAGTNFVAEGYEAVDNGNDTWTVQEKTLFKFFGTNVSLGNNLDMKFAFSMNEVEDWNGYYVEMVRTYSMDKDGNVADNDVVVIPYEQWDVSGSYYVVTYGGMAAKEMCDEVTVTVYDAEGNAVSVDYSDSMRAYAMRMYDEAPVVFTDMLNYGAAAQTYFGYGIDDLANSKLTDDQKANASTLQTITNNQVADNKFYASMLTIKSNIRFQFAFRGITEDMYAVATFTGHKGNEETVNIPAGGFTPNGSMGVIALENVVVADARCMITITVYNGDGTVYTTVQESIESYIARNIDKAEVFGAFMKFADTAYAFLHRNDT